MIDKRLKYKAGQRVGFEPGGMAGEHGMGAGVGADGTTGGSDGDSNRENRRTSQYTTGPKTRTKTVDTSRLNPVTGKKIPSYTIQTPFSPKSKTGFGPKGKDTFHEAQIKNMRRGLKEVNPGFFDSGLGKFIKTIGKAALFAYAPPIVGKINTGLQVAKVAKNFLDTTGLTEKIGLQDVNVKNAFSNIGKTSTKTGPKDPPREGGDGDNQQNALMAEYLLLLQKMEQGILQKEEQERFNSLKSRLGKAQGGIMNVNMNKGQLGVMNG